MRLFRQDNSPVKPEHQIQFREAMNLAYDTAVKEVEEAHGKITSVNDSALHLMREKLDIVDREFAEKFPRMLDVSLPKTQKEMKAFLKEYDNSVCFCLEGEEVVGYVMNGLE